ncbi:DUF998 domain-containing protein [Solihabitans fulvus]|uniref:DUF998 domain-containing protein n=1 Tax=Solihabitans fulvus TaxID=1892852 RepID=UPI001CB75EF8|nr:DUF998 domain-containing protein [Solihabitans fulvus]
MVAVVGFLFSALPMIYLHLASIGRLSPVSHTISDYIFLTHGGELLALSAVSLAVGSAALLRVILAVGVPRGGPVQVLFSVWCLGLLLAAVFPTDPLGSETSLPGAVHRYAGLAMFVSLPLAGFLLSVRFRESLAWSGAAIVVRRLSMVSAAVSVLFLLSHVPIVFSNGKGDEVLSGFLVQGLAERLLFGSIFALLGALLLGARTALRRVEEVVPCP